MNIITIFLTMILVSCGGGNGNDSGTPTSFTPDPIVNNPNTPTTPIANGRAALILNITSVSSTASVHNLQAGSSVIASVLVRDTKDVVVPNALVVFKLSNDANLMTMNPVSGNVLTNSKGVATILLTAKAPSVGGVVQLAASVTLPDNTQLTSDLWSVSIDAANAVLGIPTLGVGTPKVLPANSSTMISVPVTSLGVKVDSLPSTVFTASSICSLQNPPLASIDILGVTNGVAIFNYKNLGCTINTDVVSITLAGSAIPATISIPVSSAASSELRYIGASPTASLVVKGAGGLGRQEAGIVSFQLFNTAGNTVVGATVNFSVSTIAGGITLSATSGITDAKGIVSVILYSGKLPTPVVILATTVDPTTGINISAASSTLSISAGPPEQRSFSLGVETRNIRGLDIDGTTTKVIVRMADFWGNPITDGTVVSMISEGGKIAGTNNSGSCTTVDSMCYMTFTSQAFRPSDGIVSILAFAPGVESFDDANGNGVFDTGENCSHLGSPFIDANHNGVRDATETAITNMTPSSDTIKTPTPCSIRNNAYVYGQDYIILSGSPATIRIVADSIALPLKFPGAGCDALDFYIEIADTLGHPIASGSTLTISSTAKDVLMEVIPNVVSAINNNVVSVSNSFGTKHHVIVALDPSYCVVPGPNTPDNGKIHVKTFKFNILVSFNNAGELVFPFTVIRD